MPQTDGGGAPARRRVRPLARRALAAQSDERLVKLLREGHDAAFEEIVGRYQSALTSFAAAFIPYHRAEDVVQASLLKAHKALLADDREIALRSWLFTIVRNGSLNAIRDEPDWQELDPTYDGVPQPAAIAEQNEELQALVLAILSLPDSQRRALVGRELEGEGHAELAAELGTTTTAVRGLIFRARTGLRDALGAFIPLPLLRMLLSDSAATAGAAGGAAAGGGVGLGLGATGAGGGVKLVAALSAAALVVGGGVAIERNNRDKQDGGASVELAKPVGQSGAGGVGDPAPALAAATGATAGAAGASGSQEQQGSGQSAGSGDDSGFSGDSSGSGGGSGSGSGDSSAGNSGSGSDDDGGGSGDGGSSGPGPGTQTQPPPDDGDHSGPGPGGGDDGSHSGPGDGSTQPPPPPPPDDDSGSSGPGSGDPDDSDSGSSGPGSGSGYVPPLDDGSDDHSGPGGDDDSGPGFDLGEDVQPLG